MQRDLRCAFILISFQGVIYISDFINGVVLQVLNWRVVDSDLAIGLCTILPKEAVVDILWKMITSAWQNYEKIKVRLKFGLSHKLSYKLCLLW